MVYIIIIIIIIIIILFIYLYKIYFNDLLIGGKKYNNFEKKNYTYISVLSTNDYLPGALVVNKCLKLTKTKYPFTILVTENISNNTINILKKNNIQIRYIKNIFLKKHKVDKWYYTFSKLFIFSQIEFKKIVYIDLDMVITENLDHLFEKKHFSSVADMGSSNKTYIQLNSGLIVFKPSINIFNNLINIFEDGSYYPGDQDVLHKYFKKWPYKKELNLGYQYNTFVSSIPWIINEFKFTTINSIDEINEKPKNKNNIKIFHYIEPKPWVENIENTNYTRFGYKEENLKNNKYFNIWYDIYESIKINK